ncbi:MAG: DUF5011 domain-containing protein [Bacteroidales bacterium]|nr:DUF5011 domain-containing protein [Bacteroidales bacterium]
MRLKILQQLAILVILSGLVLSSCKKDDEDKEAPQLWLHGSTWITLPLQGTYEEPGFEAWDKQDGELTASVVVQAQPNMNQAGLQKIVYTVADKALNSDTAYRYVEVVNSSRSFEGAVQGKLVDPYPGTEPLVYTDEIVLSETVNHELTIKNFANEAGSNVRIILNHDPAKYGTVDFVSADGLTMIEGSFSAAAIAIRYEKAGGGEAVVQLTKINQ